MNRIENFREPLAVSTGNEASFYRFTAHLFVNKTYTITEILKSYTLYHEKLQIVFANIRV